MACPTTPHAIMASMSSAQALGSHPPGLATLFHRFGILAFGWDAQFERLVADLLDAGLDAVYSDHVDRLTEAAARYYPPD